MKTTKQAGAARKNSKQKKKITAAPPKKPTKKKGAALEARTVLSAASKKPVPRGPVRAVKPASGQTGRMETGWHSIFITALSECPNVTRASRKANVSRQTAFAHQKQFPEFAEAWEDALDQGRESLETEAYRRGVEGVERNRFDKDGNIIETYKEYSDPLLQMLMKGHLPGRYKDRVEHSGTVGFCPLDEMQERQKALEEAGAV